MPSSPLAESAPAAGLVAPATQPAVRYGRPTSLPPLTDYRCRCGRLKDRAHLAPGSVSEWKCQRCNGMNWWLVDAAGALTHHFEDDRGRRK